MKNLLFSIVFICSAAFCSNSFAQLPPPGAGDKSLGDNNVKSRSIELERAKRDSKKNNKSTANQAATQAEDRLAAKYDEIKNDYEQIQTSQDAIVKTYQGTGKIDFARIGESATEVNRSAARLHSNLFPAPPVEDVAAKNAEKKKDNAAEKEIEPAKSVRDLIVELDNRIGGFATSPMFQNLRTVDAAISEKARLDLEKIIQLSALLDREARKSAASEK